jgi:Ca-activated chloride channel family protein
LSALRSSSGQSALRRYGFRDVNGVGAGLTTGRGVDGRQPGTVAVPDAATSADLVGTLDAVRRDARLLAVVDVSGSMAAPVPGSGGSSRLDLALRAAGAGMELYPDTTEVGLWSFAQGASTTTDHQELVPIAPLTASGNGGREALALAMAALRPEPDAGTALYDTTLAAVRAVRTGWDPARVNAVVLLSDGVDNDAQGMGLDQLLATLRSEQASGQPVPVITIAYGQGSGADALAAISAATGGASYQASDPAQIRDIFLDAVGQRACRPQCPAGAGG